MFRMQVRTINNNTYFSTLLIARLCKDFTCTTLLSKPDLNPRLQKALEHWHG